MKKRIAILASGSGSNAESIIEFSNDNSRYEVGLIISNRRSAFVLNRAKNHNIDFRVFSNKEFSDEADLILEALEEAKIEVIVLAGFLRKIPSLILSTYHDRILNIHPSLLPQFGGKGMYGRHVHQAVIDAKSSRSGMTIHLVNEEYDKGRVLFQASCEVYDDDSVDDLASRVLKLEHQFYPEVINYYCSG